MAGRAEEWATDQGYDPGEMGVPPFYHPSAVPPYLTEPLGEADPSQPDLIHPTPPELGPNLFAPDVVPPMGPDVNEPPLPEVNYHWPGEEHMGGHGVLEGPPIPEMPAHPEWPEPQPPTVHVPDHPDLGPPADYHTPSLPEHGHGLSDRDTVLDHDTVEVPAYEQPPPHVPVADPVPGQLPPLEMDAHYPAFPGEPVYLPDLQSPVLDSPSSDTGGGIEVLPPAEPPSLPVGTPQDTYLPPVSAEQPEPETQPFQEGMVPPIGGGYYTPQMAMFMPFSPPSPNQAMGQLDGAQQPQPEPAWLDRPPAVVAPTPVALDHPPFMGTIPAEVAAPVGQISPADMSGSALLQAIESLNQTIGQLTPPGSQWPREPAMPYGGRAPTSAGATYRASDQSNFGRQLLDEAAAKWADLSLGQRTRPGGANR